MQEAYLERALFIVGPQDSGKSVQLRSMFKDWRFGTGGIAAAGRNTPKYIRLGHDRMLILRVTSPHESGLSPIDFHEWIEAKFSSGRYCFAGALQPDADNKMPDVVEAVRLFDSHFSPERIRVCFLSPDRHGHAINLNPNQDTIVDLLQNIENVECVFIDARDREANGLLLSDFMDFT